MLLLNHKNLDVYKVSLQLVKEVYDITRTFPREELFGLVSQLRRAAVPVCSNIAEGSSRRSKLERRRFYEIARGSLVEIDTQIQIAVLLDQIKKDKTVKLETYLESAFRMISRMISSLEN